jgi:hypothetical protein
LQKSQLCNQTTFSFLTTYIPHQLFKKARSRANRDGGLHHHVHSTAPVTRTIRKRRACIVHKNAVLEVYRIGTRVPCAQYTYRCPNVPPGTTQHGPAVGTTRLLLGPGRASTPCRLLGPGPARSLPDRVVPCREPGGLDWAGPPNSLKYFRIQSITLIQYIFQNHINTSRK